ncbi:hypothetical protein GGX14DRAFT_594446 [Mycena pura]|uniref:Uncharacterized protein n=1 Tax=Mycena pura TaxID=153505 RepID=A0AAD6UQF3_9AGAR|nr:hypothetical protein GGX14DRAFT_594446 [Mycena pura]
MAMPFVHNWGIPGINIPVPPARTGPAQDVPPLRSLRFSPLGLYDLRRRLGVFPTEPGIFQRYRERFLTADIAWFAGGASTDGRHATTTPGFMTEFQDLRDSLPTGHVGSEGRRALNERIQHAIFDLTTLWDRTFGSTTMVMHVEGTTMPNTPTQPEYLRAAVYLPPGFVASQPASHAAIARIVQTFIEALTQPGPGASPNAHTSDLIPAPAWGSSHYRFLGRPVGALDALLTPVPLVIIPDDDDDYSDISGDVIDALERASYAEAESAERLVRIQSLEHQVDILISRMTTADTLTADLQAQLLAARQMAPRDINSNAAHYAEPFPATRTSYSGIVVPSSPSLFSHCHTVQQSRTVFRG